MMLVRFSRTLWKTWCSFSPMIGRVCWGGSSPVNGSAWRDTTRSRSQGHHGLPNETSQGWRQMYQQAICAIHLGWSRGWGEQKKTLYLKVKIAQVTTHAGFPTLPLYKCHSKLISHPPNNFGGGSTFFVCFALLFNQDYLLIFSIFSLSSVPKINTQLDENLWNPHINVSDFFKS